VEVTVDTVARDLLMLKPTLVVDTAAEDTVEVMVDTAAVEVMVAAMVDAEDMLEVTVDTVARDLLMPVMVAVMVDTEVAMEAMVEVMVDTEEDMEVMAEEDMDTENDFCTFLFRP